jgi:hypothetical protein
MGPGRGLRSGIATADGLQQLSGGPDRGRRGLGLIWTGLVLVMGSVVGVVVAVVVLMGAADQGGRDIAVPGTDFVRLDPGTYAVWLSDGTSRTSRFSDVEIHVRDPRGRSLPMRPTSATETMTIGGRRYRASARFDAEVAGSYKIDVFSEEATLARVVAPIEPARIIGSVAGLFGAIFLAGVGAVLVVVGLIRRNRGRRPPVPGPPPHQPGGPPAYQPPPTYQQPPTYQPVYRPPPAPAPPPFAPPPFAPPSPDPPPAGGWVPPGDS